MRYSFSSVKIDVKLDPNPPQTSSTIEEPDHDHDVVVTKTTSIWTSIFSFFFFMSLFVSIIALAVYGVIMYVIL